MKTPDKITEVDYGYAVYVNNDTSDPEFTDVDIEHVKITKPNEDVIFVVGSEYELIYNLDIKNFNYTIFEKEIDNLSNSEFEYFYKFAFEKFIEKLQENYLEIEYDEFRNYFKNTFEKKALLKRIIHFVMFIYPYQVLKGIFLKDDMITENETQLLTKIDNIYNDVSRSQEFQEALLNEIDVLKDKGNNIVKSLETLKPLAKKGTLDESLKLLKTQINKQNELFDLFKEVVGNTGGDKMRELIKRYIRNDYDNLTSGF